MTNHVTNGLEKNGPGKHNNVEQSTILISTTATHTRQALCTKLAHSTRQPSCPLCIQTAAVHMPDNNMTNAVHEKNKAVTDFAPGLQFAGIVYVSALTLLVGWQEGYPACKNGVVGCWIGYLSGARCRLAYGPADATATHCLLLQ